MLKMILDTMSDVSPGLLFGKHKRAKLPKRVYKTKHVGNTPCTPDSLEKVKKLTGTRFNASALLDLYRRHDGVRLYQMPDRKDQSPTYAVELYPIEQWDKYTTLWIAEEMAWAFEDCPLYDCGTWKVIGGFGSEQMSIVMFFDGVYEGVSQCGKCYCIGLDGYLGYEEVLAENFEQLLKMISDKHIVETLNLVGFTGFVQTDVMDGRPVGYGDVVAGYLKNADGNRHLVD